MPRRMNYEHRRRKQIVDERGALPWWYERWKPTTFPVQPEASPSIEVDALLRQDQPLEAELVEKVRAMVEPFVRRLATLTVPEEEALQRLLTSLDKERQGDLMLLLLAWSRPEPSDGSES